MKILYNLIPLVLLFFLFSCSNEDNKYVYSTVEKGDFTESVKMEGVVDAVNSVSVSCPRIFNVTVAYLVEDGEFVKKGDTVCILENQQLITNYDNRLKSLSSARAQYTKLEASLAMNIALLEAQVKNNEVQTSIVFMDSLQMKYSSDVQKKLTRLEIEKAEITRRKLEDKLRSTEEINNAELRKMRLQIKQFELYISRTKDDLDQLVLIAPQDGMATIGSPNGEKLKIGDRVWPGDGIVNLPDMRSIKVLLQVPESKFKRLEMKQPVEITFDAVPGVIARGEVSHMTPVGKPVSRNSKIKVFDVTVKVNETSEIPDLGTTAKCNVIIKRQENCLVIPQIAIETIDSVKYVYVLTKGKINKQQINTGYESVENAVVTRGLGENDVILLNKPLDSEVHKIHLLDTTQINNNTNDTINEK
ncbi:efflux RND transporter periplasmic adaptor subunit [Saccharicrinis sp. FJH54]|uniref:efflux RND transporter periplasmic adaptor subunit n=1 Tax=Saccharicrinis sp. FJH54 TaxID=3344665 RepID=UPI0035D4E915